MKNISFSIILLLFSNLLYCQTITILDETNLQPIENVMVFCENQKQFQLSNAKGQIDINSFLSAKRVYFQHPSYELLEITGDKLKASSTIYLHENNIKISEVVIAANKWAQNRSEISTKITSISPKQIELENPQTAADLIGNSGEVYIQKSQQGGGSPMIRGFSTNRLLISVDGVRMNTAIFRGGNVQNIISIDPFSIEQTEVLFGPGSVIYGSDAIGGVMSFSTITPKLSDDDTPKFKGSAVARFASASTEMTGHADISMGWKKFGFTTSITHNNFGDLKMGGNGPDEYLRPEYVDRINSIDSIIANDDPELQVSSGYSQTNFMQKFRFKPNSNWDINYGFIYSETSDYSRYDRLIRYKNGKLRSAEWNYGPQIWSMNNLDIKYSNSKLLFDELSIRFSRQFFEESRIDRDYRKTARDTKTEKVWAYSTNIDFHKLINEKHQLFYGVEWVLNDVDSKAFTEDINSGVKTDIASRYPASNWSSYAVYANYSYELIDNLRLNIGSRYNYFILDSKFDTTLFSLPFNEAKINEGALTGSIGLVYNLSQDFWSHFNFSSGFRSPNVDDIGKIFDSEPGAVVVPNTDLEAEYAYNFEYSISKVFNDFIRAELTLFTTLLDNALVRRDFTFNGKDSIIYEGEMSKVQAIQNAAKANVKGVQAGIDMKLPFGFNMKSRFSYQKGTEETDDGKVSPSRHAAPWFGSTHLVYAVQKFKCDVFAHYSGEVAYEDLAYSERDKTYMYAIDDNGNPYSPAWYTLNIKALYQISKNFSMTAGIENLLNKRYKTYSSGLVAPGRNFILALKATF